MPNSNKSGQQANSSNLHTDVQPTKQATIIEPSAEAINHRDTTVESWGRKSFKSLSRVPFSSQPETYLVSICGKRYGDRVRIESNIEAYHPFMAIGQAVAEFFAKPAMSVIDDVLLYQRVIKTIKPKK